MRRVWLTWTPVLLSLAATAMAHFPFVVPNPGGTTARLVMSETLEPDPAVEIGILKGTTLFIRGAEGVGTPLTLGEDEQWMNVPLPGSGTRVVYGVSDLGVMKRGKPHVLVYYPKTIVGDAFDPSTIVGGNVPVELVPERAEGGFRLRLLVGGQPGANLEVRVVTPDGKEADHPTDSAGYTPVLTQQGRYGAWARSWADEPGEREGEAYEQVRRYATIVMDFGDAVESADAGPEVEARASLPQPVASFGAVEADGWLYVFGGHTATRHDYSKASVSGRFHRLRVDGASAAGWEELPGGKGLQGLNLAAHNGKVYRVGGMEPRNEPGTPGDSYSVADADVFDPATGKWSNLPDLPRPRSSHDVVVVGDTLMVIGGWWMRGKDRETRWHDTIETLDLAAKKPKWKSIKQPFSRRALIATVSGDRVYVIGGFDAEEQPSASVDVYDAAAKTWSKGPSIPGRRRNGFGPAACAVDGSVYLSVGTGEMFRLSDDGGTWEPFARATPRIVHRLIPMKNEILIVGGASEEKMLDVIEAVPVRR